MKNNYIIPIFIPHQGCQHECSFCNQWKITNEKNPLNQNKIEHEIVQYLALYRDVDRPIELAYYGGSFTGLPKEEMIRLLELSQPYIKDGKIESVRVSTRPDTINESVLQILKSFGVQTIELGVQSMDDEVLKRNGRGHTASDVNDAVSLIRKYPFVLGLQMMTGLYQSSDIKDIQTALSLLQLKPDFVRIYPTLVIKNSPLEKLFYSGNYKSPSLDETVVLLSELMIIFHAHDTPIIRVGLQPTESINLDNDVISGPFHPSIRQLAEGEIYRTMMGDALRKSQITHLRIYGDPKNLSEIVGHKRRNKEWLRSEFSLKILEFQAMEGLENDLILMDIERNERVTLFHDQFIKKQVVEMEKNYS